VKRRREEKAGGGTHIKKVRLEVAVRKTPYFILTHQLKKKAEGQWGSAPKGGGRREDRTGGADQLVGLGKKTRGGGVSHSHKRRKKSFRLFQWGPHRNN